MRYKNKNLIVEDIGPEPNCNYPVEVGHYYSKIEELDEVYRKAETFDQLAHTYEQYKDSHTHDLKSTMGTKAIELLEADE